MDWKITSLQPLRTLPLGLLVSKRQLMKKKIEKFKKKKGYPKYSDCQYFQSPPTTGSHHFNHVDGSLKQWAPH